MFSVLEKRRDTSMLHRTFVGVVAAVGMAISATSGSAATFFGSRLNQDPTPTEPCRDNAPAHMCTWVLTIGQQNVGHERAPKNGTVTKLFLKSCVAGSFILQMVTANPATKQAKSIRSGPAINYKGSSVKCDM